MRIVVMAGGTGGHVFPALAVADELRARGHDVTWIGAPDSFEQRTVVPHGFEIDTIPVRGLRGKGLRALLSAPLLLWRSVREARGILQRRRPHVVLGMGGFAAGPGGLAARLMRIPLVVHEQNAAPGLTNRALSLLASKVLEAFPKTFRHATTVGNPVRSAIAELPAPAERAAARAADSRDPVRLLILGGSQGARALNELVPAALALLPETARPLIRHQAGRTYDLARAAYANAGVMARIESFIDDMPSAYGWADLVVCRAGASTIAELCAAGCASVLVPFPFAVDDHQTANARHLADDGAAVLMQERDLDPERLAALLRDLLADRAKLLRMAQIARTKAWPRATREIAAEVLTAGGQSW
ncbi:UDP-N-acetylglucosamine-N-acetylmuramylpentapeptide N-acetylglucosamine transferase [Hydrocarboniphaga daqingensis]|uniref:UDP-N-acetylglucosamine--N-acetylmuramyl-(pentapeptide) pyrophosphoryl-undecaprenol N-acetylglucosamine transferase n=1 Tax=Hydrocarboniphaga daqingensis TaxID=490188 RepID=A0A1M5R849_9GAMM|nr:undecaprenyldiphospho-muramoylpentapeptide beta-N-acetylglucosaminyltransferase [Hydrocarboniphaga daqingensis]SHH22216.1 UDP-N-acetylglucosamine-N-acetylmuramylpentapeptide N-acetylglucosamine transferase [Hydrocarboniphaga daqingensis]